MVLCFNGGRLVLSFSPNKFFGLDKLLDGGGGRLSDIMKDCLSLYYFMLIDSR